ncbi:hypothetical protein VaNZ11_007175 [Volvox africanus]|uniref:Uncharacterized protein n=1 Tax=Volvox africanus TaxID=51714 RepID=A0ABQ5S343_9CHLO|nr:hypothetical protein VaNZ11_007175 [Volvox africanus]
MRASSASRLPLSVTEGTSSRGRTPGTNNVVKDKTSGELTPGHLFINVPPDRVDDVIRALRARDADSLMQLLDESTLSQHFGHRVGRPPAPSHHRQSYLVPPPPLEEPRAGYYYHDAVLGSLSPSRRGARDAAQLSGYESADEEPVTSSVVADAGGGLGATFGPRRPVGQHLSVTERIRPCGAKVGDEEAIESVPAPAAPQQASHPNHQKPVQRPYRQQHTRTGPQEGDAAELGSEPSFAAEGSSRQEGPAGIAAPRALLPGSGAQRSFGSGQGHRGQPRPSRVDHGVRVAGYRPEARPLPSKPRSVPTDEAELEATLRETEHMVVFGRTQQLRSEALFYSHQLRAALADLRLLRRKGRKAAVLHRHGMRLDTRNETGVKRIIREGRREQDPDPIDLRRVTDPGRFYVDLPRRTPQWLDHVHPDRPDPARAIDPVAWRPASARLPPPRHTPGLQAAGDWNEYRYDWDLARIRSMPVADYHAVLRKERELRSLQAELKASARVLSDFSPGHRATFLKSSTPVEVKERTRTLGVS